MCVCVVWKHVELNVTSIQSRFYASEHNLFGMNGYQNTLKIQTRDNGTYFKINDNNAHR